jgi:hypothetical protein
VYIFRLQWRSYECLATPTNGCGAPRICCSSRLTFPRGSGLHAWTLGLNMRSCQPWIRATVCGLQRTEKVFPIAAFLLQPRAVGLDYSALGVIRGQEGRRLCLRLSECPARLSW